MKDQYYYLLKRGILAIIPLYKTGVGNITKVILEDGEVEIYVGIKTVVENLAKSYFLDLRESFKYYRALLMKNKNLPLVLNQDNIYIQVKTRHPIGKNDGAMSFINYKHIKTIENGDLILDNGEKIWTFTTNRTLQSLIKDARVILGDMDTSGYGRH